MWTEKNGKKWRIRDEAGGKKITVESGFRTKTAADRRRTELETDVIRGEALIPRGGERALDQWLDAWWPAYIITLKRTSRVSSEGILRRYIRPMLGHLPLAEIQPIVVQQWVADLLTGRTHVPKPKPLSPKTVRNAHGLLHKIMSEACGARLIRWNPCERTGLPKRAHHEMRFLTGPEADRLIAALPPRWRPLILLLLGTGLRWGEAIGLRVRDVDVLTRRLRVRKATYELADTAEIVDEEPKTATSRRTVRLTDALAQMLIPLVANRDGDARVFTAPKGGVVRQRRFYLVWQAARTTAGLDGLRIHDLRHTHAAWLLSAGAPLTAIQRRLGHHSISVTSDLYGHLLAEVDDQLVDIIDSAMQVIDFRGALGETGWDQRGSTGINGGQQVAQNRA